MLMTDVKILSPILRKFEGAYLIAVLIIYICLHTLLFYYDLAHVEAIMEGDRTVQRMKSVMAVMNSLGNSSSLMDALVARGVPGDYIFHSLAYLPYRSYSIIVIQVFLGLIAVVFVYKLAFLLFRSHTVATIAALSYIVLPGSLVQPHTLVTEAFYNPLLIIFLFYSVKYLLAGEIINLIIAALAASAASFIRLIFILYPVFFFLSILVVFREKRIKHAFAYLVSVLSIPFLWMSLYFSHTDQFSMGKPASSLSLNFFLRVERMAGLDKSIDLDPVEFPRAMGARAFLTFLSSHPASYIKTLRSDIFNIGLNTGVNTFAGRYLGLYTMPESTRYWKDIRDQQGISGSVIELFKWSPLLIIINVLASILWLGFLLFSFFGFILFLKDKRLSNIVKFTVVSFPVYIISTQFIASTPRWSHRTPAEFVFAIMFALAVVQFGKRLKGMRLGEDAVPSAA